MADDNNVFSTVILWCQYYKGHRQNLFRYIFEVCSTLRHNGFEADSDPQAGLHAPFGRSLAVHDKIAAMLKQIVLSVPNPHNIQLCLPKM